MHVKCAKGWPYTCTCTFSLFTLQADFSIHTTQRIWMNFPHCSYCILTADARIPEQQLHVIGCRWYLAEHFMLNSFNFLVKDRQAAECQRGHPQK